MLGMDHTDGMQPIDLKSEAVLSKLAAIHDVVTATRQAWQAMSQTVCASKAVLRSTHENLNAIS